MRGQLRLVVDRAFDELWQPLTNDDDCPPNVFGEVFAGLRPFLREPEPEYVKEDDGAVRNKAVNLDDQAVLAMSDAETAEILLIGLSEGSFESGSDARGAVSSTYEVLVDVATDELANKYLSLLEEFIDRYSLRYYVDEKARLWISLSGLATALFGQLRLAEEGHPHLLQEFSAFEHALAECLEEPVESRIKTAIQKQVNVLEALGSQHRLVSGNTLGLMLEQVGSWPHASLCDAAKQVCKFACDYPGIRHGGGFDSSLRELDLRDLTSVTLSLVGLVAYMADGFEEQVVSVIQGDLVPATTLDSGEAPRLSVHVDGTTQL